MIKYLVPEDKSVLELFHYIDNKFQASVAVDTTQFADSNQLKDIIEDFRVRGVDILA